jgi:undecaprenyl-diphosphatase
MQKLASASPALPGSPEAARVAVAPRESIARGRWPMALMGLSLVGFAGLWLIVRRQRSAAFDLGVSMKLQSYRSPPLAAAMTAVSWIGFPPQSRVLPPLLIGAIWVAGFPLEAVFLLAAWGTATLSTAIKVTMRRARPLPPEVRVVTANLGGSSFPSGHVLTYVGLYGFLAYLCYSVLRPPRLRVPLTAFFGGLIGLVGPSRIYQGHHWPTDVVASYLLGIAYLLGLTTVYRRIKQRRTGIAS